MSVALSSIIPGAPRLRGDLSIVEQVFRGEKSFVVKDPSTQKYFRFRPVEVGVMRCFDGRHTHDQIATSLAEEGIRLTSGAVEAFARKLAGIGLLERSLAERTTLELERMRAERRKRRTHAWFRGELLRMRWSFGDPDQLFNRTLPAIRWMFTPAFVVASVLLFAAYFVILAATWTDFSATVVQLYGLSNITFDSVFVLWVTGIIVVLIHELGHGYTCKYFGGEVHELGMMVVYFQPAFYCNVNDAWSFPSLRARMWVTAAGSWIQVTLASLAAIAWLVAKPGTLVSEIAVATMIVGGVSTVVTNANPLLPLDGYFILTDWLEIPNLRIRARTYFGWWVRRNALRLELPEPAVTDRERRVFLIYGSLAAAYTGILLTIIAALMTRYASRALGVLGALLVMSVVFALVRTPALEWGRSLALAWRARGVGKRGWRTPALVTLGIVALLAFVPWTMTTSGQFTVAPRREQRVTATDSGVIAQVLVQEGARVKAGAPLARIVDRALDAELLRAARAVDSLTVAVSRARASNIDAATARLEAEHAEAVARLASIQSRVDALTMRALWDGVVATPRVREREGARVNPGDEIMRLATLDSLEARIALGSAGAMSVHTGQVVHLVAHGDVASPINATVATVAPAGAGSEHAGVIEVRVPVGREVPWRAGSTGEASVEIRRSTMLGALWWAVRQRIRGDVLL